MVGSWRAGGWDSTRRRCSLHLPTVGLLAYFHLNNELNILLLAAVGALGATLGTGVAGALEPVARGSAHL